MKYTFARTNFSQHSSNNQNGFVRDVLHTKFFLSFFPDRR